MRQYETSHKWLTFNADLTKAPHTLWMNLGEAKSKCEHIANEPLRPTTAKELHLVYLAKGVMATTAIEGNTLTEEEVRQQIEGKLKLPPSKEYLRQEVENIILACNQIKNKLMMGGGCGIGVETIKQFDRMVLEKLQLEAGVIPGEIRTYSVGVGSYLGAPAVDCEFLLGKLCDWLGGDDFKGENLHGIIWALLKAIIAHLYLAWIHPFGDGNGRTARLVEFQILLSAGVPSPAAHLLSNHYNQTRQEYYRQLDHASKSGGDIIPFICYAIQGFVDGLAEQLDKIKSQQLDVFWRNYVFEKFRHKSTSSAIRQRTLALELGQLAVEVGVNKIPELTPELAKLYANKTIRTVQRDVFDLEAKYEIIRRTPQGVRALRELILGFLPHQKTAENKQPMLL